MATVPEKGRMRRLRTGIETGPTKPQSVPDCYTARPLKSAEGPMFTSDRSHEIQRYLVLAANAVAARRKLGRSSNEMP